MATASSSSAQTATALQRRSAPLAHSWLEDTVALLSATALAALGVGFFADARLLTGGTAGLALLLCYHTGLTFGPAMLLVNVPFLVLGAWHKGWRFVGRSAIAVGLLAGFSELQRKLLVIDVASPLWSATLGGLLVGVALLMLFRHRASLGGVNILALWAQERLGWRAGWVQMGLDGAIVLAAIGTASAQVVVASLLGALVLNASLALNHRPERYVAM